MQTNVDAVAVMGLMSGTSMDGIDAALIRTDGERVLSTGPTLSEPYDAAFRAAIEGILGATEVSPTVAAVERDLTLRHATAVRRLLSEAGPEWHDTKLIGFHGQTISHAPNRRFTWQIGDGGLLAQETGLGVVFDLRGADVAAGGEGAPLAPVYHRALAHGQEMPLAVLNIGGVSNVTYLEPDAEPIAFDTGPGNGLIDDWMQRRTGVAIDRDGKAAAAGNPDRSVLHDMLAHPYFGAPWPKSLDRRDFEDAACTGLGTENGAATLLAFTVETVARGIDLLPNRPVRLLVTGGGRRNPTMMAALGKRLPCPVDPVEAVGWDGDMLEAQAFAFMAVRSRLGLPISFPGTTGVERAMTGGRLAA